jgi:hypothetical protein
VVTGVAADGVTEVIVGINGALPDEHLSVTIDADGGLASLGSTTFQSSANVKADPSANAFLLYLAPADFALASADDVKATRMVTIHVRSLDDLSFASDSSITIVRPLVMLIHGIWSNPEDTWGHFTSLTNDPLKRFAIAYADYDKNALVNFSTPSFCTLQPCTRVRKAKRNSLGVAANAPFVLTELVSSLESFRSGGNPARIPIAATQVDVVAHSLGGLITRGVVLEDGFLSPLTFGKGLIHKLITIDTPHLGTPLARDIFLDENACVRDVLATQGDFAFVSVETDYGDFSGAAGDMEGDGFGGMLSATLQQLQRPGPYRLPTAFVGGITSTHNLVGLDTSLVAEGIHDYCGVVKNNPLAKRLTSVTWNTEFGQPNDGIVPLASQIDGLDFFPQNGLVSQGVVHSIGTEALGFNGPSIVDDTGASVSPPKQVIFLLNLSVNDPTFYKLNP